MVVEQAGVLGCELAAAQVLWCQQPDKGQADFPSSLRGLRLCVANMFLLKAHGRSLPEEDAELEKACT